MFLPSRPARSTAPSLSGVRAAPMLAHVVHLHLVHQCGEVLQEQVDGGEPQAGPAVVAGAAHGDGRPGALALEDALFAGEHVVGLLGDDHQVAAGPQVVDRRRDDDAGVAEKCLLEDPVGVVLGALAGLHAGPAGVAGRHLVIHRPDDLGLAALLLRGHERRLEESSLLLFLRPHERPTIFLVTCPLLFVKNVRFLVPLSHRGDERRHVLHLGRDGHLAAGAQDEAAVVAHELDEFAAVLGTSSAVPSASSA